MIREILLLGNPKLYQKSAEIIPGEIRGLGPVIGDLHDTLMEYRRIHGAGRAIAAPQIGVFQRLVYLHIQNPVAFVNPVLSFPSRERMEVLDDCMSFPHLLVKVRRYRQCRVDYLDLDGQPRQVTYQGDLAELIQHEYDHLDGILATMRAVDNRAFFAK